MELTGICPGISSQLYEQLGIEEASKDMLKRIAGFSFRLDIFKASVLSDFRGIESLTSRYIDTGRAERNDTAEWERQNRDRRREIGERTGVNGSRRGGTHHWLMLRWHPITGRSSNSWRALPLLRQPRHPHTSAAALCVRSAACLAAELTLQRIPVLHRAVALRTSSME